jgi:ribosomal-protein-alanine N-acetyltransferase
MSLLMRDDIVTSRLTLIATTPEMLLSEKNGDGRLGELIQCVIPANWPQKDWEPHVFDFLLNQLAEHPEQLGWPRYVSFVPPGERRTLIGTLGAFTKAATPSVCEIGYSILAPYEGRGFATEGARALIDYLRGDERLDSVIAHTFPSIPASIRVMEKCGMVFDGEGEELGTIRYRLGLRSREKSNSTSLRDDNERKDNGKDKSECGGSSLRSE